MSVRPYRDILRRQSRTVHVGAVAVGGDAPISVQSMTNTLTSDVAATVAQIRALEDAGADIVRVSCPDEESTAALKAIVSQVTVPIVADIHFHYRRAIEAAEAGAACLRINPGNIGSADRVKQVVDAARSNGCSMRIGVNAGSLEKDLLEKYGEPCPEAMVESALDHARILEDNDFFEFKISVKASDVFLAVAAYQGLAEACDYPLHIGITEAGGFVSGTVKSSIGMGMLLWSGIGDTVRVSLSADPVEEVRVKGGQVRQLVRLVVIFRCRQWLGAGDVRRGALSGGSVGGRVKEYDGEGRCVDGSKHGYLRKCKRYQNGGWSNEWIRNRKAHSVAQPSPRVGPTQALAEAERAGAVNQRLAVKPSAAASADAMRDSALLLNPPIGFTYQRKHP